MTGSCAHPDFHAEVDVNRLEDIGAFTVDVRIRCLACDEPFAFIGMAPGISSDGPRVSISQLEAHLPIRPSSAALGNPTGYGFGVRVVTNAIAGESGPRRDVTEPRRRVS